MKETAQGHEGAKHLLVRTLADAVLIHGSLCVSSLSAAN
jgi:hypothetical protein